MNKQHNVQIIIDSTTDIPERLRDQVRVVPLTVLFDEKEYRDGIDLTRDEFYKKLEESAIMPKTSQATPAAFEKVFAEIHEEGREAVVITLSSSFSGTFQSACIAAEDYPEVHVFDSRSVAIGAGILTEYALSCADKGMGADELMQELEKMRGRIRLVAMLDTLEYLQRGGRISKTAAFAGGILNIKPVINIDDGQINVLGKARGVKKANNYLVTLIEKDGVDYDLPVLLGYTGTSDTMLHNYIKDSRKLWEPFGSIPEATQICTVIGTHAGPGVVAAAFFSARP